MSTVDVTALRQSLGELALDAVQETGEVLGSGCYGDVVVVKYDGLRCAGKKLHDSVFASAEQAPQQSVSGEEEADAEASKQQEGAGGEEEADAEASKQQEGAGGEAGVIEERFSTECRRINKLRHPNIVQLFGVHVPAEGSQPILVMEFVPFDLPTVLEKYRIPTYAKRSILLDVATAMQHLHGRTPPKVHGHLTANSVLLTSSLQAKVTACFLGSGDSSRLKNLIYSAPEVRRGDQPTSSGDVFSFGNLIIHVSLHKEIMLIEDASMTEVQRRERFLSDIEDVAQITELAKKCLQDDPLYRPVFTEIVYQLHEVIKANPPEYASYLHMLGALDKLTFAKETIASLNAVIKAKDEQLAAEKQQQESLRQEIEAKEEQIAARKEEVEVMKQAVQNKLKLVQANETAVRAKDALIKAKVMEIAGKEKEVVTKDSLLRIASKRIEALEQQAVQRRGPVSVHVRTPSYERGDLSPGFRSESPLTAPKPVRSRPISSAEAEDLQTPHPVAMRKMKGRRGNSMIVSDGYRYHNWGAQKSKSIDVAPTTEQQVDPKLAAWMAKRQQIEEETEAAEEATKSDLDSVQEDATVNGGSTSSN